MRTHRIRKCGKYMLVNLARGAYTAAGLSKITTTIPIPREVDLDKYMAKDATATCEPGAAQAGDITQCKYEVVAYVVHAGDR